jgi:penicillin-binding protein 1A
VPVITKIVDRNGETLWESSLQSEKVLSERVSSLTTEILRNVMENGTGRSAKDAIKMLIGVEGVKVGVPIPSYGKTGTANRFTNSSFVGFVPGPNSETGRLELDKGYVIASYVGYDDNRPMESKNFAIYGASGALPLWIDTANAIVNSEAFSKHLAPADLAFNAAVGSSKAGAGIRKVRVSPVTGLPLRLSGGMTGSAAHLEVLTDVEGSGDKWTLKSYFEPISGENER